MKRTISVMVGKGSVNHNSRQFHARNTDPERSDQNVCYRHEPIEDVYHTLFDKALEEYNARQKRKNRCIPNYYEKICSGRQEKPFHEVILQIGNREDTNAQSEDGQKAAAILDEYMKSFQDRNPYLRVFSAHLHMDEATPHLHIDFVPFTTGSKQGLETRVSLKQALGNQGFKGGSRQETEWNQWVQAEKEQLASIMERHGMEWEKKGTHEKHLSVLDYEKKMRSEEVAALEQKLMDKEADLKSVTKRIDSLKDSEKQIIETERQLASSPEYRLPEPAGLMAAKSYKAKFAEPVINRLKVLVKDLLIRCARLMDDCLRLRRDNGRLYSQNEDLTLWNNKLEQENYSLRIENSKLRKESKEYKQVKKALGKDKLKEILSSSKQKLKEPVR